MLLQGDVVRHIEFANYRVREAENKLSQISSPALFLHVILALPCGGEN